MNAKQDYIEYIRNRIPLGNIIIAEGINRYVDQIVDNAEAIIKKEEEDEKNGSISWISNRALVRDAKEIKKYLAKITS
tara:strand:+ start:383 stop:616 length:234 start_codon:yes stop_codon:yes gene_type:complete